MVEGAHPRVSLQAQPPSITEWSMDLHYGFPAPFRERGGEVLRGLWPFPGHPLQSQDAPWTRLPWELPEFPFFSPLSPASLGFQALCLPQVSLAAVCSGPAPTHGAGGPSWLLL